MARNLDREETSSKSEPSQRQRDVSARAHELEQWRAVLRNAPDLESFLQPFVSHAERLLEAARKGRDDTRRRVGDLAEPQRRKHLEGVAVRAVREWLKDRTSLVRAAEAACMLARVEALAGDNDALNAEATEMIAVAASHVLERHGEPIEAAGAFVAEWLDDLEHGRDAPVGDDGAELLADRIRALVEVASVERDARDIAASLCGLSSETMRDAVRKTTATRKH